MGQWDFIVDLSTSVPHLESVMVLDPSVPISSQVSRVSLALPYFAESVAFSVVASRIIMTKVREVSVRFTSLS